MNRLVWKELVEQRNIPLAYAAILASILIIWDVMGNWVAVHGGRPADRMNVDSAVVVLTGAVFLSGLFPGCIAVAGEAGQGTIGFLGSLPVSKFRIWLSKTTTGIVMMLASICSMLISFSVIVWIEFHATPLSLVDKYISGQGVSDNPWLILLGVGVGLYSILFAYSIAVFSSSLTDRPVSAFGIATGLVIGVLAITQWVGGRIFEFEPFQDVKNIVFFSILPTVPGFLIASCMGFSSGSMLNLGRKRVVGAIVVGGWGLMLTAGVAGFVYLRNLAAMEFPNFSYSSVSAGSQGLQRRPTVYRNMEVQLDRVQVGKTYHSSLYYAGLQEFAQQLAPNQLVTPDWNVRTYWHISPGPRIPEIYRCYEVQYKYTPKLPLGDEVVQLKIRSVSGNIVGILTIRAHKTHGYFPPPLLFFPEATGTYLDNNASAN